MIAGGQSTGWLAVDLLLRLLSAPLWLLPAFLLWKLDRTESREQPGGEPV